MVSSISGQNIASPNFKKGIPPTLKSVKRDGNYEIRTYETEASTGKKWGVGIASFCLAGLGQAINGEWGKAAGFFVGSLGLGALAGYATIKKPVATIFAGLGALGLRIWSIVDAVKNAKTETTHVVPINQNLNING